MRAIAPVEGIPPTRADPTDAMPWPNNSRLGSNSFSLGTFAKSSATRAASNASIAANKAIAIAGEINCVSCSPEIDGA